MIIYFLKKQKKSFQICSVWPPRRHRAEWVAEFVSLLEGFFRNTFIDHSTNRRDHRYCVGNVCGGEQRWSHSMHATCALLLGHMACCHDSPGKTGPSSSAYLPWLFNHESPGCCNYCFYIWWDREEHAWGTEFFNPAFSIKRTLSHLAC